MSKCCWKYRTTGSTGIVFSINATEGWPSWRWWTMERTKKNTSTESIHPKGASPMTPPGFQLFRGLFRYLCTPEHASKAISRGSNGRNATLMSRHVWTKSPSGWGWHLLKRLKSFAAYFKGAGIETCNSWSAHTRALAFCMQEFTSDYPCSEQRKASEWFISLVMFFWHFMMTSAFILPLHPTLPAKVM